MRRSLWVVYLAAWAVCVAFSTSQAFIALQTHQTNHVVTKPWDIAFGFLFCLGVLTQLVLARWRVRHGLAFPEDSGLIVPVHLETLALGLGFRVPEAVRALRRSSTDV